VRRFFDTNILVYAFLGGEKRGAALSLLAEGGIISNQVINEFTNVARKKRGRAWSEIAAGIAVIRSHFDEIALVTLETHQAALDLASQHGLNFYDALIIATAIEADCDILFSEDMQHDRSFGKLIIRNPFLIG
jgi:predicted nucleic acid-binding protein